MKVVGRAVSTIGNRMLIIQCDAAQLPPLYSEVTDRRMRTVGKILDLFGNVKAPYAAILCHEKCSIRPDEKLFAK
ncbi:MAG TPA: Gar1/Naf1 family protein [Methanoregula sp.]|nr:Gar1/Naf1 family protein [Methanoregula sp.]